MRRAQTFGRPAFTRTHLHPGRGLNQRNAQNGLLRVAPFYEWGVIDVLPEPRTGMGMAKLLDGRIVVTSGLVGTTTPTDFQSTDDGYVYAADALSKVSLAAIPFPASDLIATTLGDGRALFVGTASKAMTLHPGTLLWTTQPDIPSPNTGINCTLTTLANGNALLCGGLNNSSAAVSNVWEFNQGSNTWIARPSMASPRAGHVACLLSNGNVMVSAGGGGTIEIYDATNHLWTVPLNSPQPSNRVFSLLTLSDGRTLGVDSRFTGPLYTIHTDIYSPLSNRWTTKTSALNSWQGETSGPQRFPNLFEIGNGWCALISFNIGRKDFYDFRRDQWQGFDALYPERLAVTDQVIVQLSTNKNSLLMFGAQDAIGAFNGGYVLPHRPGRYVELSSQRLNSRIAPTFGGVTSVEGGADPSRVVVHWNAASHPTTHPEDINYFVYISNTSGGQDFSNPFFSAYVNTSPWAGTHSIELFNLTPDTDYYFVVRARDMVATESFVNEDSIEANWDQNVVEVFFHTPLTQPAPTFSWHSAPAMCEPRAFAVGIKLARSDSANGDNGRLLVTGGSSDISGTTLNNAGDIYDQTGTSVQKLLEGYQAFLAKGVDGDATIFDGGSENRRATVLGGEEAFSGNSQEVLPYYPYAYGFNANDGFHDPLPQLPQSLSRFAVVGIGGHDLLIFGGMTSPNDTSSAIADVNRLRSYYGSRIFFTGGTGNFTVGLTITGGTSGATGIIRRTDLGSVGTVDVDVTSGFFVIGEPITDTGTGDANVLFTAFNRLLWYYTAEPGMLHSRSGHSAVLLDNGSVLIAGGLDASGQPVLDIEIYDPVGQTYSYLPGYTLAYSGETGAGFLKGNFLAADTGQFTKVVQDYPAGGGAGVVGISTGGGLFNPADNISDQNLPFNTESGFFTNGQTLTGGSSGATAIIYTVVNDNGSTGILVLGPITGAFTPGEPISDGMSGSAIADGLGVSGSTTASVTGTEILKIRPHVEFPMVKVVNDGRVLLIAGSQGFLGGNGAVDIFDPSGPSVSFASDLPTDRTWHTAHCFGDGQVGVFGGQDYSTNTLDSVYLYDIGANTWTAKPNMGTPRYGHVSFLLANNTVLVCGGVDNGGTVLDTAEISGP